MNTNSRNKIPSKSPAPNPIGYVEVQRSWVGPKTADEIAEIITTVEGDMLALDRDLMPWSSRVELATDGAGNIHGTLYAGFAPRVPAGDIPNQPLDPRNMNEAPLPVAGDNPSVEDALNGSMPLGYRETKF